MGIEFVCVGFMKILVVGAVHNESIGCGSTTDHNAIHRVSLLLGPDNLVVLLVVEVAHGKEKELYMAVVLCAVNTYGMRCQFIFEFAWNHFHNLHSVPNRIELEVAGHLLFSEVGT